MDTNKMDRLRRSAWLRATAIRCLRTFLTTILGVYTADTIITDVDWRATLLAAVSATVYIFILCIIAGLPEVDNVKIYNRKKGA